MDKRQWLITIFSLLLIGLTACSNTQYKDYNPPQSNPAIGGGCGISPQNNYEKLALKDVVEKVNNNQLIPL